MRDNWDDVRRIADEIGLKLHLAGMEARDRWRAIEPRLAELEKMLAKAGQRASEVIDEELSSIGAALRRLRDDLASRP
jgi:hypothetical protein